MNRILLPSLIIIVLSVTGLCAQKSKGAAKIGDDVSKVKLRLLDSRGARVSLGDYKGKVILLDFWATWCAPCLASMPTMHELQEKYKDDIQIILVNDNEARILVEKFVSKRAAMPTLKITLPIALADSVLSKYFAHEGIPHIFWIDRQGILRHEGSKFDVTDANIESIINNGLIKKFEFTPAIKFERAITNSSFKSELSKSNKPGKVRLLNKSDGTRAIGNGQSSIIDLYRFVYGSYRQGSIPERSWLDVLPFNRVIVEANAPFYLGRSSISTRQSDSLYTYSMSAPNNTNWNTMAEVMKADLARWFKYDVRMEKRKVKHFKLIVPDSTAFRNVTGERKYLVLDTQIYINNITIKEFLRKLTSNIDNGYYFLYRYPIAIATDYKGPIGNIAIENVDTDDPYAVERAFSSTGLQMKFVEEELEVLVVRDKISL